MARKCRLYKAIGHGEAADVFAFDRRIRPRLVVRIPKGCEHSRSFDLPERAALHRYRGHQIAYLLFPANNLKARAFRYDDLGMVSDFVARTRTNKKFSVQMRRDGHYKEMHETTNPIILRKAAEMNDAGIYPSIFESDVMIGKNGEPFFFEIHGIDTARLRDYVRGLPEEKRRELEDYYMSHGADEKFARALSRRKHAEGLSEHKKRRAENLARLFEMEQSMKPADLGIYMTDPEERKKALQSVLGRAKPKE